MEAQKIILDCDPGCDDAVAMLLAWGSPVLELVAVTTVAGNQSIDKVTRNALAVAELGGMKDLIVAKGCARPLVRQSAGNSAFIHGESGLGGQILPEPRHSLDQRSGAQVIIDTIMHHPPKTITLVPTGPLTNIALAVRMQPEIVQRVKQVVLMGGGAHGGNQTAVAEFNILSDPEAAYVVFNEPWPLVMLGLDVTLKALATSEVTARLAKVGTRPAKFVCGIIDFYGQSYKRERGLAAPPLHDPCAVACVIEPSIFTLRSVPVDIELDGSLTRGMTVCDFRTPSPANCHTRVALDLDRARFWDLVVDALERIGEV